MLCNEQLQFHLYFSSFVSNKSIFLESEASLSFSYRKLLKKGTSCKSRCGYFLRPTFDCSNVILQPSLVNIWKFSELGHGFITYTRQRHYPCANAFVHVCYNAGINREPCGKWRCKAYAGFNNIYKNIVARCKIWLLNPCWPSQKRKLHSHISSPKMIKILRNFDFFNRVGKAWIQIKFKHTIRE